MQHTFIIYISLILIILLLVMLAEKLKVAYPIILVLGGLGMLLGVYPNVGIALLIIFLLGASFPMHDFWNAKDPQAKQADLINL